MRENAFKRKMKSKVCFKRFLDILKFSLHDDSTTLLFINCIRDT